MDITITGGKLLTKQHYSQHFKHKDIIILQLKCFPELPFFTNIQ